MCHVLRRIKTCDKVVGGFREGWRCEDGGLGRERAGWFRKRAAGGSSFYLVIMIRKVVEGIYYRWGDLGGRRCEVNGSTEC